MDGLLRYKVNTIFSDKEHLEKYLIDVQLYVENREKKQTTFGLVLQDPFISSSNKITYLQLPLLAILNREFFYG